SQPRPAERVRSESCLPPAGDLVDSDGQDDQHTSDEHLVNGCNSNQLESIAEDADDKRADQRADDSAAATEQARTTQHHGGNAVEVVGLARVRIANTRARDQQQPGQAVDQASHRVHPEQKPPGVDGGMRTRVTRTPFRPPNAMHTARPITIARSGFSPALTASEVITIVPSAITAPFDRSMPAVRMTSV